MTAPFYRTAKASAQVLALLGAPEPRIYPWGENDDQAVVYPYCTWLQIGGGPDNYLAGRPDSDRCALQIDVWSKDDDNVQAAALALRDAIELHCYITSWRVHPRDPATRIYRVSFDVDWHTGR